MEINTFKGYIYVVEEDQEDPYYNSACETEEFLISADEFMEAIGPHTPLSQALIKEEVTDVLLMLGW